MVKLAATGREMDVAIEVTRWQMNTFEKIMPRAGGYINGGIVVAGWLLESSY